MIQPIHGQEHIVKYAEKTMSEGRFPHTLLLSGKAGYGLFPLGLFLAQKIMCTTSNEKPCQVCANCGKIRDLQHPDVHLFFPTSKADESTADKMSAFREMAKNSTYFDYTDWLEWIARDSKSLNINKSIVNEINRSFSFKAFEGGRRVFIIWGAEYLGNEGNKLLKIIEEPPEGAYVILMAENRQALLTTILSRCQTLLLKPLQTDDLLRVLGKTSTPEVIRTIQLAEGDVRRAQHLFGDDKNKFHPHWLHYMRSAFKGNPTESLSLCTSLANEGKEFGRQFFRYGLYLVSMMLKSAMSIPMDADESIEKLARLLTYTDLEALNDRLQKDFVHVNRNANLKLLYASQHLWITEMFRKRKKSIART